VRSVMTYAQPGRDSLPAMGSRAAVDLYWILLGAEAHVVRISGRLFEAATALVARRPRCDLYHSALVISAPEGQFVIEQAPIPDLHGERRGVVAEGPVGMRWLRRFRVFRYEIRRWRGGSIPDINQAIGIPVRSPTMSRLQNGSSKLCRRYRRQYGAVTNLARVRCGTRTRLSPGCRRAVGQASKRSIHRPTVEHPDGTLALQSLHRVRATTGRKRSSDRPEVTRKRAVHGSWECAK